MPNQPVLIAGQWRPSDSVGDFQAEDPARRERLEPRYPVSSWNDCDAALDAALSAAAELRELPAGRIADFLDQYAARIEARASELVALAVLETGLPAKPRLADAELPRTVNQLRQGAAAAREGSWSMPTIDPRQNIRSCFAALGPIWVFGPNNFPFAFNSVAGGDFVAAIAAGNPVIAKANTSHPGVTRLLAELAQAAVLSAGLPAATVQMIYRLGHADGARALSDARTGATGYTGSRQAGLTLKAAADAAGKPIYLELSSINPVVILPGALRERGAALAAEFSTSCLMGSGQFCTNPGLVLLIAGPETEAFIAATVEKFRAAPPTTLLGAGVARALEECVSKLSSAGAEILTGGEPADTPGYSFANTLLRISAQQLIDDPENFQTEAFGNASLLVVAENIEQARQAVEQLEGNLTGSIYSDTQGSDDAIYAELAAPLRQRVGRLLNDKMPTGVAVSPAMNHGGPYPATGHPGFTAVGIPASLRRFAMLECYDGVRPDRLPAALRDANPDGRMWRSIDGQWTRGPVGG